MEESRSSAGPVRPAVQHRARRRRCRSSSAPRTARRRCPTASVPNSPSSACTAASAAAASLRLSLSALVSSTSSLTSPLPTRGAMKLSSWRSRSVKPRRESIISTMPLRLRRTLQVVGHHLLPAQLGAARNGRVTVARQVGEQRVGGVLRAELEQVDVLRASRRLRREGEPLLLRQPVDRGRLAGVRAADEGDLRQFGGGQLVELAGRGQKARACASRPGRPARASRVAGGAVGAGWKRC